MKVIENEILINASSAKIWEALTKSEFTKIYMYGCNVLTDWKVGSTIDWEGEYDGKRIVFVTGKIINIEVGKQLVYSVIDPNASYPMTPINHLNVTYGLISQGADATLLKVRQDGFEEAEDGEKRYADVYNDGAGWMPILEQIKGICED